MCCCNDFFRCHPGSFFCPFRGAILYRCCQLCKAGGPLLNKLFVIEVIADNDVDHCQSQSRIGSRSQGEPELAFFCCFGTSWINGYADCTRIKTSFGCNGQLSIRTGNQGVMPPKQDTFWFNFTVIITNNKVAIGQIGNGYSGDKTLGKTWFIPVWCPQGVGKTDSMKIMVPSCSLTEGNGFRPGLLLNFGNTTADFVKGI